MQGPENARKHNNQNDDNIDPQAPHQSLFGVRKLSPPEPGLLPGGGKLVGFKKFQRDFRMIQIDQFGRQFAFILGCVRIFLETSDFNFVLS